MVFNRYRTDRKEDSLMSGPIALCDGLDPQFHGTRKVLR